uniref:Uncharacterized protein n=1 Tax=Arundo donax TaxID=35708 RepID=A0A0A8YL81_ARUDO
MNSHSTAKYYGCLTKPIYSRKLALSKSWQQTTLP